MRWQIDSDGIIYSSETDRLGFFDVNGDVYDATRIDAMGSPFGAPPNGFVDTNGDAYNEANVIVGFVDADGWIYDMMNAIIARVDTHGLIYDSTETQIGVVNQSIHKTFNKKGLRKMWLRAAAAPVLILRI